MLVGHCHPPAAADRQVAGVSHDFGSAVSLTGVNTPFQADKTASSQTSTSGVLPFGTVIRILQGAATTHHLSCSCPGYLGNSCIDLTLNGHLVRATVSKAIGDDRHIASFGGYLSPCVCTLHLARGWIIDTSRYWQKKSYDRFPGMPETLAGR